METTLSIQVNNSQMIAMLRQLNNKDRISIFREFKEYWFSNIFDLHQPIPMSVQEYNIKLEQGLTDYQEGNTINHADLLKEVEEW